MATPKSSNKNAGVNHSSSVDGRPGREAGAAGDALHGVKDQVKAKVAELGAEAQQAAFNQIGSLQKRTAEGIHGFADTVEDAGKLFAEKQSPRVARLVQEGAWALRDLAGSLSEKPIADVVEDVRTYGRAHPAVLVGGAMLAGVAIGRLMRSAPASQSGDNGGQRSFLIETRRAFDPELPAGETAGLAGGEL